MTLPHTNPFATRYVRPRALPFVFPPGHDARALVVQLQRTCWWGQIVGAHGVGKTTLLHTLAPLLQEAGRKLAWFTMTTAQRRLPRAWRDDRRTWDASVLVMIDGYEQLGWLDRWRLQHWCRRTDAGLLVASHRGVGLPTLLEVRPSLDEVQQVVAQLLRKCENRPCRDVLDADDVARQFAAWGGNTRELLFSLYDLYELRVRAC